MTLEELGKKILEDKEHKDYEVLSFGTQYKDFKWYNSIWIMKGKNSPITILFEKE